MKKKSLIPVLLSLMVVFAAHSETGIGAAYTYGLDKEGVNSGAALSISTPSIPGTVQNIRLTFDGSDYFSFSVSDDWWVIEENVTGQLDMYIGLGFFTGFSIIDDESDFSLGGRIPVGLTIKPVDFVEFFVEVVPVMGVGFEPTVYFPAWSVQSGLGMRLWF